MAEYLGRHSGDGSYWTADLHVSKPSPCDCPPGGLLMVKVCFNNTNLFAYLDRHGISRWSEQYSVHQITTPTLHFPGTMNRADYYSILHQWLRSSHINLPLDDDVATDLSNRVIDRVFERLDLDGKLAISVTAYLHRVSIEFESYVPPLIDVDDDYDDDDDDDEGLSEYWINALSCWYRYGFVAEEHRRFGNCSICLEGLVSDSEEDEDEDEEDEDEDEDEGNKYLFKSPCGHVFHEECMVEWLRKRDSCPLCRFVVSSHIDQLLDERLLLLLSDSR